MRSLLLLLLVTPLASGFVAPRPLVARLVTPAASMLPEVASSFQDATSSLLVAANEPLPSALVAYTHYASLLVIMGALTTERLSISNDMTPDDEQRAVVADAIYGVAGLALVVSGYYRATEFGKGWDFYSHEPLFWLKLTFVGVAGALSFFPTIVLTKRGIAWNQNDKVWPPQMSKALVKRMHSLINAELIAYLSIPLVATTMARGVGYMENFPWQAGAAIVALATGGAGYKYIKEGLSWKEEEAAVSEEA